MRGQCAPGSASFGGVCDGSPPRARAPARLSSQSSFAQTPLPSSSLAACAWAPLAAPRLVRPLSSSPLRLSFPRIVLPGGRRPRNGLRPGPARHSEGMSWVIKGTTLRSGLHPPSVPPMLPFMSAPPALQGLHAFRLDLNQALGI